MRTSLKTVIATTAAAAVLFVTANPAAATTVNYLEIKSGTLVTPIASFDLAPGAGTAVCAPPTPVPGTIAIEVDTGPVSDTEVVGIDMESSFSLPGQNYLVDFSLGGGAQDGYLSNFDISQNVSINAKIYKTTLPNNCVRGTLECDIDADLALEGNVTALADSDGEFPATTLAYDLVGGGPTFVVTGCNAPFDAIDWVEFLSGDPLVLEVV